MTSARELSARLASLLSREHSALADFLVALSTFDEERRWSDLGYANLFDYLHRELGLSAGAAHYRKVAAGAGPPLPGSGRADPRRAALLHHGRGALEGPHAGELAEVLPRFFHRSKREAMAVAAEIRPEAAPQRTVVTALAPEPTLALPIAPPRALAPDPGQVAFHPDEKPVAKPRDVAVPVNAQESRMHVTVTRRLLDKLAAARDALSHSKPGATDAEILETGLDLILAAAEKRKGIVAKPRKGQRPAKRTTIPAAVKREVWKRDQGRCQYRLPSGETCGSTCRLEFDHVVPLALDGESTVDEIPLLCRPHNETEARRKLGDAVMDRYVKRGRKGDRVSEEVAGWGRPRC